jgi:hypothetical protein
MKINAKLISEKVDYYIDLIFECDENAIETGVEPEEGEKQKKEIIDDITEEDFKLLNDEEDDIDSEKDLDKEGDGKEEKDEEEPEDVKEQFSMAAAKLNPKIVAIAKNLIKRSGGKLDMDAAIVKAARFRGATGALI